MTTTHFRNGVSNQAPGNPLFEYPYLDPFKYYSYVNDFFTYTAGDWTITTTEVDQIQAESILGEALKREHNLYDLLIRPEVTYQGLIKLDHTSDGITHAQAQQQIEIQARYGGYIKRQRNEIARQAKQENSALPETIDYQAVRGLSNEVRLKLAEHRPATIGQASRIPGVTPVAVSLLLVHLKKRAA